MTKFVYPLIGLMLLGACSDLVQAPRETPPAQTAPATEAPKLVVRPPANARTAAQFDTTSTAEREAAKAAAPKAGETRLGTTVATLGPAAETGIWLKTSLVSSVTPGRVTGPNGKSINVELRPAGGAGTQISLAALRLLELPLTAMPSLTVYR